MNFDPQKNYQIYLEEQAIIATAHPWSIPGMPKIGYWPIAENNGHIAFGKESYLELGIRLRSKRGDLPKVKVAEGEQM